MKFPDLGLFLPALLLTFLGLLICSVVSPQDFAFQWKIALCSIILAIAISNVESELIYLFAKPFYILIIILLILLLLLVDPIRGSRRWFDLGFITIQVSEFAKLAVILMGSGIVGKLLNSSIKRLFYIMAIVLLPTILVFLQPDFGTSLIIASIVGFSAFTNKINKLQLIVLGSTLLIVIPVVYSLLAPYQKARLEHFLNPGKDPLGASYNQVQAMISIGSGQIIGKGLGKGSQSRLEFLPEKQTDFFFATAAEQLGFIGSLIILLLFTSLAFRILAIASKVQDLKGKTVIYSCLSVFYIQPMFHIGINLGILPVTGIPLSFMSVGGSSLLATWMLIGIMAAIEKDNRERYVFEIL